MRPHVLGSKSITKMLTQRWVSGAFHRGLYSWCSFGDPAPYATASETLLESGAGHPFISTTQGPEMSPMQDGSSRADYLETERLIRGDRYLFIRSAFLQYREYQINDGAIFDDPCLAGAI